MDHRAGLNPVLRAARRAASAGRWKVAAAVGLLVGAGGALFALSGPGTALERSVGLDWLFGQRGPLAPPDEVVVVAIDSRTGEQAGLAPLPREWSRSVHARLVDTLVERGASAIAFDMQFDRPHDAAGDQAFADAVARADRVALIQLVTGRRQPVQTPDGRAAGTVWVEGLIEPLPSLRDAARALATFPLPKIDAVVTEFWAFKDSLGDAATLPAAMLQLHLLRQWPAWQAVLASLPGGALADLPEAPSAIGRADALAALMTRQREALAGRPVPPPLAAAGPPLAALAALYAGEPHRTLNFYGPPGTVATVPFQAVLDGTTTFDFRGKAVFVGYSDLYDPGQPDRFYTVFTSDEGVDLSGVEIAATAFANLLEDRSIDSPGAAATTVSLLLFGVALGALAYLLPALASVPLVLAVGALWAGHALRQFELQALWVPVATPLLVQLPLALLLGLLAQYLLERGRRVQAGQTLRYYLPEHVARELTEHGVGIGADAWNRVVWGTCLATDMSGFSTISERLPPDQLARFLNDYFDTLAEALRRHGVDITEFRADAIMCAWTADAPSADKRRPALLAALAAGEAIERFRAAHPQLGSTLRIGLQCGRFHVGNSGGGGHFVFSIVGDTANTASRLESLNKHLGTSILAGGEVVDGLDRELLLRPLGSFQLMGKGEGVAIVEVLASQATATAVQRERARGFAAALALYRDGALTDALSAFEALAVADPDDGPPRFFIGRCQRELAQAEPSPLPRAVIMDSK